MLIWTNPHVTQYHTHMHTANQMHFSICIIFYEEP